MELVHSLLHLAAPCCRGVAMFCALTFCFDCCGSKLRKQLMHLLVAGASCLVCQAGVGGPCE